MDTISSSEVEPVSAVRDAHPDLFPASIFRLVLFVILRCCDGTAPNPI